MDKSYFHFDNQRCELIQEKRYNPRSAQLEQYLLVVEKHNEKIHMAYEPGIGLRITDREDSGYRNNILGEFLALKKDDLSSLRNFIFKYGFFFPIEEDYLMVDTNGIYGLVNRMNAVIRLINNQYFDQLAEKKNVRNYGEMLESVFCLLLSDPIKVSMGDLTVFESPSNTFIETLNGAAAYDETQSLDRLPDRKNGQIIPVFTVNDSLSENGFTHLNYEDYLELVSETNNIPSWCKNVVRIYINKDSFFQSEPEKTLIDLLFHFITECTSFDIDEVFFSDDFRNKCNIWTSKAPSKTYNALEDLAKFAIKKELDSALKEVSPKYNIDTMKPDWGLPSLLSALYFSLFYLDANESMYRMCENPSCGQYFEVAKTNKRKKYCCRACGNAAVQRRYKSRANKT